MESGSPDVEGFSMEKLTRQGVRDLGDTRRPPCEVPQQCDHRRLRWCCPRPCGHILCPDCDLYLDLGAENLGRWVW